MTAPSVLGIARILLALLLGAAGAGKLGARDETRRAAPDFGVPGALAAPLALLLPLAELALAGALLPAASARLAAFVAAALFAVFAATVAGALARGRRPECNCFGRLHSSPIGMGTLLRNIAFMAVAGLVAWRPSPVGWVETAAIAGVVAIVGQAWLWLQLLRRYGRALVRIAELEEEQGTPAALAAGDEAPPFVLPDLDGEPISLEALLGPVGDLVLFFTDPRCGACDLALDLAGEVGSAVVAISTGPPEAAGAKAAEHELETVLVDERREVGALYRVAGFPTAFRVDADGHLVGDPAVGHIEVAALLTSEDELVVGTGTR